MRALLAGPLGAIAEAGEGLLPGYSLQREVDVNKPMNVSVCSSFGRQRDLHAHNHRSRDVSGEQTESTSAKLPNLKSPARDQSAYVAEDCDDIEYCKVQRARRLAMLLHVLQTEYRRGHCNCERDEDEGICRDMSASPSATLVLK